MAYRIDDDENRIQDLKDKIDQLEVQTFSPEVVGRNESTRDTGIQTGDSAATNAYPLWMPIRDFGTIGNITLEILLNRVDGHVAKMTLNGDTDFAFSLPPGTDKMMQFVLDVTIDGTGGYTINLPGNLEPGSITIDNTANARTILKIQTTDGAVTYQAQDILATGGSSAGYDTIQEEGTAVTQRTIMNFIGASVTAVDNPGNSRTDITITSGASGTLSALTIDADKDWNAKKITNLGGITMAGDIDVAEFDLLRIDRAQFVESQGSLITVTDPTIYVSGGTANGNLVINNDTTKAIIFTHDNVIGLQETVSTLRKSRVNGLPILTIVREGTVPAVGTTIADIRGLFPRTTGGETLSSIISFTAEDIGDATHEGGMAFQIQQVDNQVIFMDFNDGKNDLIRIYKDFDFNSHDALKVDRLQFTENTGSLITPKDPTIYVSGGTANGNLVINNDTTKAIIFTHDNVIGLQETSTLLQKSGVDSNQFIRLVNTFSVPATGALGAFEISGVNDTPTQLTMAFFAGSIVQITSSGSGSAQIGVAIDGAQTDFIRVNDSDDGQISFLSDVNFKDNFIQFTERAKPTNPAADNGLIYVKDNGGISTPFFLDSAGTETSMIESASISNVIIQENSSVLVTDTGSNGLIAFTTDSVGRGTISSLGWAINNGNLAISASTGKISFNNGFSIENTNATTTTLAIPSSEILLIKVGTATRIQIDDNVTLNADNDDDLIFQHAGTTVGLFDGSNDNWKFNPANDVQLSPAKDVDLTPTNDIIMNPGGDIKVSDDLDMQGSATFDSGVALSSAPGGSPIGAWQIKIQGVTRKINVYSA